MKSCTTETETTLIVAHRGASADAPENTIPAFLLAWEQGADAIEGDFFITADNEIVCIHDRATGRVAKEELVVSESTLAQLQQLDVGAWKGEQWKGTTIPTIAQVFALVPEGKKILVEVKSGPELLPRLYEEIDQSGLKTEQIVVISFNADVIREFKQQRPQHKAFWLSGFRKLDGGELVPDLTTVLNVLKETGANGLSSHHGLITPELIKEILANGYEYHVWTVNDPARAHELIQFGAMSVTTDVPLLVREYLGKH